MNKMLLCLYVLCVAAFFTVARAYPVNEENTCSVQTHEARAFFINANEQLRQRRHAEYLAMYTYNTNVTEENRKAMIAAAAANAVGSKALAARIKQAGFICIEDDDIQRQASIFTDIGFDILEAKDFKELRNAISAMQTNYATAKVCAYENPTDCTLTLEPHIQSRFSESRDPQELAHYWRVWHDTAGTPMRANFAKYIELSRKAAKLNNYTSNAEYWIHFYNDPDFEQNLDAVYHGILPLYKEIHGYVRYRLREHYGAAVVPETGNIPMHLLGNMWAQNWDEAIDIYTPYPQKPFVDVTRELQRQKYSIQKLFELGDQFFKSLGMRALPASFWNLSVLVRPQERQIVCHASAWDLFVDSDVRIKMCTELNMHYLYVVHHELGHIQYYLQYDDQPAVYRNAPNPGFHEAVGDVIALSVATPKHLKSIGLSAVGQLDEQSRINELFKTALKKLVFLPFAYTMDKYRYAVFRGEIDASAWNCAFWKMRSDFSGVEPPVARSDADFDPPAKYHIDADVEYLRYFAAHIFQFQFHKALCKAANQYVPGDPNLTLDNCDIYNSKPAGALFGKMLAQGQSRPWKEVLKEFTGETAMDPAALLEYFAPLTAWLQAENKRLGVRLGWPETDKIPSNCGPLNNSIQ